MDYILIGRIVNTHGLKGELRIISDFEKKDQVFIKLSKLYIGEDKIEEQISSYRRHKNYDMVKFLNKDYINEVLIYKSQDVYIKRSDIKTEENDYLLEDLIGATAYFNDKEIGEVVSIENYGPNKIMLINEKLIPYNKHFIKNVNLKENRIDLENVEGLV